MQILYLNHGVGSDFEQNSLTDGYLTEVMHNIRDKKNFRIFQNAIKSNNNFFTSDVFKEASLEKLKAYGKINKLG